MNNREIQDRLIFNNPLPLTRSEAEEMLSSGGVDSTVSALLSLAYHDTDWRWVQSKCIEFTRHRQRDIQRIALICLGHIARINRTIDKDQVLPVVRGFLTDPDLSGAAQDVLDDIETFVNYGSL